MDCWMIHVVQQINKSYDHPAWPCWSWAPGDHGTPPGHGIAPPVATDPQKASGTSLLLSQWNTNKKNDSETPAEW